MVSTRHSKLQQPETPDDPPAAAESDDDAPEEVGTARSKVHMFCKQTDGHVPTAACVQPTEQTAWNIVQFRRVALILQAQETARQQHIKEAAQAASAAKRRRRGDKQPAAEERLQPAEGGGAADEADAADNVEAQERQEAAVQSGGDADAAGPTAGAAVSPPDADGEDRLPDEVVFELLRRERCAATEHLSCRVQGCATVTPLSASQATRAATTRTCGSVNGMLRRLCRAGKPRRRMPLWRTGSKMIPYSRCGSGGRRSGSRRLNATLAA